MIESSTPRVDRVLVVLRPASRSEAMQRALEKLGLVMVSFESSAAAAAALDETPVAAVLLDVAGEDSGLVPLIRQIRSSILHAAIPVVLAVADPDSPLVAAALDAGASERVLRSSPAQAVADILQSRIETAASPQRRSKGGGELWVVCGPRGGVGRTMIASNLAVLAADSHRVALVDNVPRFGSALVAFNLPPQTPTWVELTTVGPDEELFDRLPRHPSGVSVLPAPSRPELADSVAPAAVGAMIMRLTHAAELVVADQGGRLDNGGIDMLESSDHMVVVGTPDNPGVYALLAWLRICDQLRIPRQRISVLLNCVLPYHQVDADRAAKVLEQPVLTVPHAGLDGVRSLSGGEPLAWRHPGHRWVKSLRGTFEQISPVAAARLKH
ncbi:MAG: AAA family ATPase [Candidatus Dormibacteria bacterium]